VPRAKGVSHQVLIALLVRGFGAGASFALSLVVARVLNTTEAGLFFIAFTIVSAGSRVASMGMPTAILKVVGANEHSDWGLINNVIGVAHRRIAAIGFLVVCVASWLSASIANYIFGKPMLATLLPITSLCVFLLALLQVLASAIQGRHRAGISSFVLNSVFPLVIIIGTGILVALGLSIDARSLVLLLVSGLLVALAIASIVWWRDSRSRWTPFAKPDVSFNRSVIYLSPIVIMDIVVQWSGYFLGSAMLSSTDMAIFSTAQRTAMLGSLLLIGVNLVVAPKFSAAFTKSDMRQIKQLSRQSNRLMLIAATPFVALILAFPSMWMGFFGAEYERGSALLQILTLGQFINLLTGSVGYLLMMTNHERDYRNIVLLTGPFAIGLAFVLTNFFGVVGAAIATAVAVATQNLLAVYMVKKRLGFNTLSFFSP